MFKVIRSFFFDEATFTRVVSDAVGLMSIAAVTPGAAEAIAALAPGAGWVAPVTALLSFIYSARSRQKQTPP